MENVNAKMDEQLKARVDDLERSNDENRDGKLDAADLKAQLNRIEAQLELQDRQNRGIIANQRKRMIFKRRAGGRDSGGTGVFGWRMNIAYNNVMDACSPRQRPGRHGEHEPCHAGPERAGRHDAGPSGNHRPVEKIDVDALNNALTQLPALMDTVNSLQSQVQSIVNLFSGLSSVFGR